MAKFAQGRYQIKNPDKYIGPIPIIYRSSWERKFMIMCDTREDVSKWSSEPVEINYIWSFDKREHKYYPDFYMKTRGVNGDEEFLVEIKPEAGSVIFFPSNFVFTHTVKPIEKGFRYANMCDWNGKKKIPKYKKDFFPIATSTTYFNVDILSKTTVHGKKIEESYGISMPISIPGSIGITLHFRKQNDYLYVGITSFKEIFSADKVKESLINSFNRIKDLA